MPCCAVLWGGVAWLMTWKGWHSSSNTSTDAGYPWSWRWPLVPAPPGAVWAPALREKNTMSQIVLMVISTWHCVVLLTKWNISFLWWYTKGLFLVTGHKSSCFRTQTQNHYMKKRKISNVKKEKKKNKQLWAKTLGTDPGSGAACCSCCCCCCCSCNCCCCCICRAWVCWDSAATFPAHWRDLKLWTESSL